MSEYDDLIEGYVSHGMTVNDRETADALDEILGAPSSEGERRPDVAEGAGSTPAGPTEICVCRHGVDTEDCGAWDCVNKDEPPHEEDDWPEPPPEIPLIATELHLLRPDHRPKVGAHYVVFGGVPLPVKREMERTEDEFVRSQMDPSDTLKDPDGQRRIRADRTLRLRYRGYVSGEMSSL